MWEILSLRLVCVCTLTARLYKANLQKYTVYKVADTLRSVTKPAPQYQLRHPHTRPDPTTNNSDKATRARTTPLCLVTTANITQPNVWFNHRSVNNEHNWVHNILQPLTDLVRPRQEVRWMPVDISLFPVAQSPVRRRRSRRVP
jgi:hypothetical protein